MRRFAPAKGEWTGTLTSGTVVVVASKPELSKGRPTSVLEPIATAVIVFRTPSPRVDFPGATGRSF
jgi:hypothetical protein